MYSEVGGPVLWFNEDAEMSLKAAAYQANERRLCKLLFFTLTQWTQHRQQTTVRLQSYNSEHQSCTAQQNREYSQDVAATSQGPTIFNTLFPPKHTSWAI